jgi:glycosyltransferase involved in cell wall biosynthesis
VKIDVVVLTRNSEKLLPECLTSIYEEVPVCHLIVVDGFSTDRTLEIVGRFEKDYGNVKVIKTEARHGKAREIGIKNVDTEWFVFIDSDAVLQPGWFEKISQPIKVEGTKIGAVESNFVHHYPEGTPKFPQFDHVVKGKRVDPRALTITTLIKKEAVGDIVVPDDLPIYEDEFIKRWIERKGFTWLKVVDPVVDHFPRPKPFKDAYLMGIYSIRYRLPSPWRIVIVSILSPLKFLYFWVRTRSLIASWNSVLLTLSMLRGLVEEILGIAKDKKSW